MSDVEYVGKISPQPFISMAKEEQMRIEEIKKRILREKTMSKAEVKPEPELTYERYISNDFE